MAQLDDEIPQLITHDKRVPLTILTGYLGAGKSTLIKHILTQQHGHRIAVIVNEFGDTADIERRSISVDDEEQLLELDNGCLCCSIRDAGVAAIAKMMRKKGKFDYIILETTGLADPSGLAQLFWENELFIPDIYLDGVVCVVDARNVLHQLSSDNQCVRQIASADSLIVNKVDLVGSDVLEQVKHALFSINSSAPLHYTTYSTLNLHHVIDLNAYDGQAQTQEQIKTQTQMQSEEVTLSRSTHSHPDSHSHPHPHLHLFGISSIHLQTPPLSTAKYATLDKWLRCVLWESTLPCIEDLVEKNDMEILRTKGVVSVLGDGVHILQGVRDMYELKRVSAGKEGDTDTRAPGKIVFIGKNVDHRLFATSFSRYMESM
ncbi:hypothetical protein E3P96_03172 [Wallemia ichthyophaga]|nr:hypothetical protein E3P96_03172 [Wallemia ichthyophaga]